jgi:hypothetical protein
MEFGVRKAAQSPLSLWVQVSIWIFCVINTRGCKFIQLPLLLERVGERRIKTSAYIPLIPTFSLKGEGADTYGLRERAFQISLYQLQPQYVPLALRLLPAFYDFR